MLFLLDTDHISLLQRGNPHVIGRLAHINPEQIAVTVITAAEQFQGRLATIRRAKIEADVVQEYERLRQTIAFYRAIHIAPYSPAAATEWVRLRKAGIRIGTQDLRIAAIALVLNLTLVTRNSRDFERVPLLHIEDWSRST